MPMRKIVLGVTGGIAAYKATEICRGFQKEGFDVWVVMTDAATKFIAPLTFESLTGHPVAVDLFDNAISAYAHITLAEGSSAMVIAPCTANSLAKIAYGFADNTLTATALAMTSAVFVAPAMNVHMYTNPATQDTIELLKRHGVSVIEPVSGHLACGDEGMGKLPEPTYIVEQVIKELNS